MWDAGFPSAKSGGGHAALLESLTASKGGVILNWLLERLAGRADAA